MISAITTYDKMIHLNPFMGDHKSEAHYFEPTKPRRLTAEEMHEAQVKRVWRSIAETIAEQEAKKKPS